MSVSTYVQVHMHTHVHAHTCPHTHTHMQVWNYIYLPLAWQINISNQGLEIKPHLHQTCSEGSNKPCFEPQRPRYPTETDRTVFDCLLQRYRSEWTAAGAGALGAVDLGMA